MDTTRKGNKLEDQLHTVFSQLISEGQFFARSDCCQIYKQKGYYSRDRETKIYFDLSIEVTMPGQDTYSLLILIECKNYAHRVPVDDVEEFFTKCQQVAAAKSKAVIASTSAFQVGAFNFARSKGVGLLRYYHPDKLDWVLTRSPSSMAPSSLGSTDESSAHRALHVPDYVSRYFDFYGYSVGVYTISLNHFFSRLLRFEAETQFIESLADVERTYHPNTRLVPYKQAKDIEATVSRLLERVHYVDGAVPINDVCDLLSTDTRLAVRRLSPLGPGVLGSISFDPPVIDIDDAQAGQESRARFALAHELGHLVLNHEKYMSRELCHEKDVDLERKHTFSIKDISRLEWQANYFASCLLLPTDQTVKAFLSEAAKRSLSDRGHGLLYLDQQRCNLDAYYSVTNSLVAKYKVSRRALKIRLIRLGLITEGKS